MGSNYYFHHIERIMSRNLWATKQLTRSFLTHWHSSTPWLFPVRTNSRGCWTTAAVSGVPQPYPYRPLEFDASYLARDKVIPRRMGRIESSSPGDLVPSAATKCLVEWAYVRSLERRVVRKAVGEETIEGGCFCRCGRGGTNELRSCDCVVSQWTLMDSVFWGGGGSVVLTFEWEWWEKRKKVRWGAVTTGLVEEDGWREGVRMDGWSGCWKVDGWRWCWERWGSQWISMNLRSWEVELSVCRHGG